MSFETLNLAGSLLRSSRLQMDVASRNLAGANEAGYVRQSALTEEMLPASSRYNGQSLDSMGARISGINRAKTQLLDAGYRLTRQSSDGAEAVTPWLERVEGTLARAGGLAEQSAALAQKASNLASNPGEMAVRAEFLQAADGFASELRHQAQTLDSIRDGAKTDLAAKTERASTILGRLAELNPRLVNAAPSTMGANRLLDERDRLLDELHGLMDVQVAENRSGDVTVYQNGTELVFRDRAEKLGVDSSGQVTTGTGTTLNLGGGSLQSLRDLVNTELPVVRASLDALATSTATSVNAVHRNGYGMDGATGRDLFTGTGAADLRVALTDARQLGAAVGRLESAAPVGTSSFASARDLNSQAANLTTPVSASGSLTVNGTTINYTDSQTLDDVLASFQAAGVSARYDSSSRRVVTSSLDGAGPAFADVTGNFAAAFGLTGTASPGGPGDGEGARALANVLGNGTLTRAAGDMIVKAGQRSQRAGADLEAAQATMQAAEEQRQSVQGVSTDEELLNLTKYQQAFAAAARVASVADEVLTTLLRELG